MQLFKLFKLTQVSLQAHLLTSDKYAVSLILNKIQGTVLKKELAILYGKLQVRIDQASSPTFVYCYCDYMLTFVVHRHSNFLMVKIDKE